MRVALIHSPGSRALVKETASFTTANGAHFRTLIPFSPSLNAFYLTESIPRSKVTEPVQRGDSLWISFSHRWYSFANNDTTTHHLQSFQPSFPLPPPSIEKLAFDFFSTFRRMTPLSRCRIKFGYRGEGGGRSLLFVLTGKIAR